MAGTPQGGTATQPVTFKADPGAVIESRNDDTSDGINLEGSSYVIVDGFTVDNASGDIDRACIRTVSGRNVTVRSNDVSNCGTWGIFTSHSDYVRIEGNKTSFNNSEPSDNHGIYVSNATVDPVIVGNEIRGNRGAGLHMNGDLSQGGNGLITGARVEGIVIYGNGEKGDRRSTATACRTPSSATTSSTATTPPASRCTASTRPRGRGTTWS